MLAFNLQVSEGVFGRRDDTDEVDVGNEEFACSKGICNQALGEEQEMVGI